MKVVATVVAAAALVLPAAQAAERKTVRPVLGMEFASNGVWRLAWFDPLTAKMLPRPKARLGSQTDRWSFSPDRSVLAIAAARTALHGDYPLVLRFVDVRRMRVLGDLDLGSLSWVVWVRRDRLLAVVGGESPSVAVVDPIRRVLVRRVALPHPAVRVERLPDGFALLLSSSGPSAPAIVAVVDAEGAMHTVALERISLGTVPGFAVDPRARRAFVVGADFTVAEVDLDTLAVTYHGGTRALAKFVAGPWRSATWLGGGLLAVAGADYPGDSATGTPLGLRLVDTRDWSSRLVDPNGGHVWHDDGSRVFLTTPSIATNSQRLDVFGMDGSFRYRVKLALGRFEVHGPYGYVCRESGVVRIVDARTGKTLRVPAAPRPPCPTLLYGRQSG